MIQRILLLLAVSACIASCTTEEIGNSKDVNPDTIYTTYTTTYNEASATVNNRAQFRFAGPDGTTLVLSDSSYVQLDGKPISIDSTKFFGAFYDLKAPAAQFSGNHTWTFTDIKGKRYEETFNFEPVSLRTVIPSSIKAADIRLAFAGVKPGDSIDIAIMDTSKRAFDVNSYTVQNNEVLIPAAAFKELKKGPLEFSFSCKRSAPVKNCPKEGGQMRFEFNLKDQTTDLQE